MWIWARDFGLNVLANIAASAASPTDVIGYVVALAFVLAWLVKWHRARRSKGERGVDSWYFIALSLLVAVAAVGAAAYGIGLRSNTASVQTQSAMPLAAIIKDPYIDWDASGRVSLQGRYARSDGPVSVYVTYGQISNLARPQSVISGTTLIEPRIKIGSISHFDQEEKADITIGVISAVDGNQQIIQWGERQQNNTKVGITWASYFGTIILVWPNGSEASYSFAIVSKSQEGNPSPPMIIGPNALLSFSKNQSDLSRAQPVQPVENPQSVPTLLPRDIQILLGALGEAADLNEKSIGPTMGMIDSRAANWRGAWSNSAVIFTTLQESLQSEAWDKIDALLAKYPKYQIELQAAFALDSPLAKNELNKAMQDVVSAVKKLPKDATPEMVDLVEPQFKELRKQSGLGWNWYCEARRRIPEMIANLKAKGVAEYAKR